MNPISSINGVSGPVLDRSQKTSAVHDVAAQPTSRRSDKVELSEASRLLSRLAELPDVRQDLVDRVREEIAAGNYETPDKIDAVVNGIAEDLSDI